MDLQNFLEMIEGGKSGATRFGQALSGTLVVATTPFVGVLAGIAGGPIAGAVAAASYGGLGLSLIEPQHIRRKYYGINSRI